MLVKEIIGIHYEYRVKYIQGMKGQDWLIDDRASVQIAQHTSRNVCVCQFRASYCAYAYTGL